jgi:hypothetical protein
MQRSRHAGVVMTTRQPTAFPGYDGDDWWIPGHVGDAEAIAAARRCDGGGLEELEGIGDDELCVTRGWWRDAHDPADDERWVRCAEGEEGAEPWTLVEL